MPSNKETLFQDHICQFLETVHQFHALDKSELPAQDNPIIADQLTDFIKTTQADAYAQLAENYHSDSDSEIIKALEKQLSKSIPLWRIMRDGLDVKGEKFELYKPKPRSVTSPEQEKHYQANHFSFKKEYYYNSQSQERIDLVIWLNGLPIIVVELKHEDEGQTVEDAIDESFLKRDLDNRIYQLPFLYIAASDSEVKVATNPANAKHFRWFNAQLFNQVETHGEFPVEHLYRHAFSKDSIAKYLEYFLVQVPAKEEIKTDGEVIAKPAFTIFPRYHQLRASQNLSEDVRNKVNQTGELGLKYLINHSAGSGKTLTIAWMADLLDGLYDDDNHKIFDNIVILTDRRSLDKNVRDDLENFTHLNNKIKFAKKSRELANHLEKNRDIIVSTIHKFDYIQEHLESVEGLKERKIVFLIDEAHRSQEGKMALTMRQFFTAEGEAYEMEEDEPQSSDTIAQELENLDISNQVFVAFTATTTPKTVSYFGEPFDTYTEEEAIEEGYILDVAQNIISYETMYHLQLKAPILDAEYPAGVVANALKNIAYSDEALIQYKSEVMVKLFIEQVANSIEGKGKAMVVASSRPAGLIYFNTIKTILAEKNLPYKPLFAFSDYTDDQGNSIEEVKINELDSVHNGKLIEDVFDENDDYRILIVANKFQTGFDQPLLSSMFLDKPVNGVNAVQTVSRLNRMHPDKSQDDILVVDFTNNSDNIFKAFNQHRKGSPYEEQEPDKSLLSEIYDDVIARNVFDADEITDYVTQYQKAEKAAFNRESELDALLSNTNQDYRKKFQQELPSTEDRKEYVGLLNRYTKQYYFIAKFFELDSHLHEFVIFAEVMKRTLIKKSKISEIRLIAKHIEVSKGAVVYKGAEFNPNNKVVEPKTISGGGNAENRIPKTTIQAAIDEIEKKYNISDEDAIIIREVCNVVSNQDEVQNRIVANCGNTLFLDQYEPTVKKKVIGEYLERDLWDKLDDPLYNDDGGIFTIMSKSVIQFVCGEALN